MAQHKLSKAQQAAIIAMGDCGIIRSSLGGAMGIELECPPVNGRTLAVLEREGYVCQEGNGPWRLRRKGVEAYDALKAENPLVAAIQERMEPLKVTSRKVVDHAVVVTETIMDNGDVVFRGECEHGWSTGFHTSQDDAHAVAAGHGTVERPLYVAPRNRCQMCGTERARHDVHTAGHFIGSSGVPMMPVFQVCGGCAARVMATRDEKRNLLPNVYVVWIGTPGEGGWMRYAVEDGGQVFLAVDGVEAREVSRRVSPGTVVPMSGHIVASVSGVWDGGVCPVVVGDVVTGDLGSATVIAVGAGLVRFSTDRFARYANQVITYSELSRRMESGQITSGNAVYATESAENGAVVAEVPVEPFKSVKGKHKTARRSRNRW